MTLPNTPSCSGESGLVVVPTAVLCTALPGYTRKALGEEQADWVPPGLAIPIGAGYWHAISGADSLVHSWGMGQAPLSQTAGWEGKVVLYQEPNPEGEHGSNLRSLRIDLAAMREYTQAVVGAIGSC